MKKRLYRKILTKLMSLLPDKPKRSQIRRTRKLAALICGMMRKKKSTMKALGSGIPQFITAHSQTKASKAFLDNAWNDYEVHYLPYMRAFLPQFMEHTQTWSKLFLVIDGSQMGNQHIALMISLVYKNRSIPLCWVVKKGGKGHFTTEMHVELLTQLQQQLGDLFPIDKQVIVLGDGEFGSTDLQSTCLSFDWDYVFRIAKDTVLYEAGDRFQPKHLQLSEQQHYLFIEDVEFTTKRSKRVNFLYWHDPKHEEPIALVSNLDEAIDIAEAYDRRYAIECLFKDLKSTSFNIHKTRLKSAEVICNLIMVAAFAFTLLIKLATKYENHDIRRYVHRLRPDRIVCSIYFFALDLLDVLLDEEIDFDFSFQFSKFSMNDP